MIKIILKGLMKKKINLVLLTLDETHAKRSNAAYLIKYELRALYFSNTMAREPFLYCICC